MDTPAAVLENFDGDFEDEFAKAEGDAYEAQKALGNIAINVVDVEMPPLPVEDTERANRSLRAIKYWRAEMDEMEKQYNAEIGRLQMRLESEKKRLEKRMRWHEVGLFQYFSATGKKKVKLAYGSLSSVAGREKVNVSDFDTFLVWAKANAPNLIRCKEEPDKTAIKKFIKDSGEEPAGCSLEIGEDTFKVDVD